jgi:integrase
VQTDLGGLFRLVRCARVADLSNTRRLSERRRHLLASARDNRNQRELQDRDRRDTYASLALAKGVNAAIVSRRLGHATVAFTLDIYSHVLPQVDAEAAEVIAMFAPSEGQSRANGVSTT